MEPTSSASPAALARYGRAGADVGARAAAEANHLDAALASFLARCREYSVPGVYGLVERVAGYGRHEAELAAWAAVVADGFRRADSGASPALIGPPAPPARRLAEDPTAARWNREARWLTRDLRLLRRTLRFGGRAGLARLLPVIIPGMMLNLRGVARLSVRGATPPDRGDDELSRLEALFLALHGFWRESMDHLEPEAFRELSAELDALNLAIALERGIPWFAPYAGVQAGLLRDRRTGALGTKADEAFPWSTLCRLDPAPPFRPSPADALAGEHGGISYKSHEQVLLERLGDGVYRVSIAGLDPKKPGAPNNLEAVALTAQGAREGNHYYAVVKARFLAALRQIPPGSTLHLQGHSMGGGMCFLLRGDPEVRGALAAAGIVVGSLVTYGAVRPKGKAGDSPGEDEEVGPFARLEERHYVNLDDSLARNVGAGHADYPHVIMLGNGKIDEPSDAHNGYGDPESYVNLPPELLELPYLVDPESYEVYNPAVAIEWADMPELAPPSTPAPSPAPAPTPAPTPGVERSPYVTP